MKPPLRDRMACVVLLLIIFLCAMFATVLLAPPIHAQDMPSGQPESVCRSLGSYTAALADSFHAGTSAEKLLVNANTSPSGHARELMVTAVAFVLAHPHAKSESLRIAMTQSCLESQR